MSDEFVLLPEESTQPVEAKRDNSHKCPLSEVHHFNLEPLAWHMHWNKRKYPDVVEDGVETPNWKLGGKPDREYLDAAQRHLDALVKGEVFDTDPKTGKSTLHASAVAWNMLALISNNYGEHLASNMWTTQLPEPV